MGFALPHDTHTGLLHTGLADRPLPCNFGYKGVVGDDMTAVVIGVDVGTGSARAGVFSIDGRKHASAVRDIRMWRPLPDHAEQSTNDIWAAVCSVVQQAMAQARAALGSLEVRGVGFDATCSLAMVDRNGEPLSVSTTGAAEQNIIVWLDHRALAEADHINQSGSDVLRYVGGRISLEMETPKLLWIKRHLPQQWERAGAFFDLPDYLTWRATGSDSRSLCSTVCKWTALGQERAWDPGYFRSIGLEDLADEGFRRIGTQILPMGEPVGSGLSREAAAELGLEPGVPVGTSAIDAHAGGIGTIGATLDTNAAHDLSNRLALICGTSSCHMALSQDARFVPGVWGPYFSAMVPGLWLNEGGQSTTGALLDHVVASHARGAELTAAGNPYEPLNQVLARLAETMAFPAALTRDLHVLPYYHGNRSPRADATLRGMVSGLALSAEIEDLARQYLATVQAIAYGTRHIIAALDARGYAIDTIVACGGLTKNPVFLREHADATGCAIALPEEPDAVLLGAAVLGAVAGSAYGDIPQAMAAMTRGHVAIAPDRDQAARYHDAKYSVFHRMHDDQLTYRELMSGTC